MANKSLDPNAVNEAVDDLQWLTTLRDLIDRIGQMSKDEFDAWFKEGVELARLRHKQNDRNAEIIAKALADAGMEDDNAT